jgi:hypothetical protein
MKQQKATQRDTTMSFDGMVNSGSAAHTNRFAGNQSGLTAITNAGRGSTVGNSGRCHSPVGEGMYSKAAPAVMATPSVPAQGSVRDSINRGQQYRGEGGSMPIKKPASPDRINAGNRPGAVRQSYMK